MDSNIAAKLNDIATRCWSDEDFRAGFLADPAQVLRSMGLPISDTIDLVAREDADAAIHLTCAGHATSSDTLSDAQLEHVSGGATYHLDFLGTQNGHPASSVVFFQQPPGTQHNAATLAWLTNNGTGSSPAITWETNYQFQVYSL